MKKLWMGFIVLCAVGCAVGPRPVDPGTLAYGMAQTAVNELFTAYTGGFIRSMFGGKLDVNSFPSKENFLDSVELAYPRQGIVGMDAFIDSVQAKPGIMNVRVRWEKKYNSSSGLQLDRGTARLTFQDRQGQWQLKKITGENPFN